MDYPTWGQRKAWNNDGMDPDWRPDIPTTRPKEECVNCGKDIKKAMVNASPKMDSIFDDQSLTDHFPNPTISIPKDTLKEFNAHYKELSVFVAWVCGVKPEKLSRIDMIRYIQSREKQTSTEDMGAV